MADEPPEKLHSYDGPHLSENLDINYFPEFENYQLMKEYEEPQENENLEEKKFIDKVGFFLKKVGKNVKKATEKITDKIKELELGEKLKTTGSKAYVVMKKAGGFVVMKTKPVVEKISEKTKEGFDKLTEKTKEGAEIVSKKTNELFKNIKSKIRGKEEETNEIVPVIGEIPVSDYYELNNKPTNNNIVNFIEEKEVGIKSEIQEVNDLNLNKENSFTLLNNSSINISIVQEEEYKSVLPTLNEIENSNKNNNNINN